MFEINKCKKTIKSYEELFDKFYYDEEFINEKLGELYVIMKEMAPIFAKKEIIKDDFRVLIKVLNDLEKKLPNHFILENNPVYDLDNRIDKKDIINKSEEEIVKYIVNRVRSFMVAHYSVDGNMSDVDLGRINLLGQCVNACDKINFVSQAIKVSCRVITIPPAFCSEFNVYERGGNHQFCLITIGEKSYIVDVTYSQFFTMSENNLKRIGIPLLGGCKPGIYMTLDEKRKAFAIKLMRDGFVEATDENIKLYFDGFAMSYRNGLYYENLGKVKYSTDYTSSDYLNFIEGNDNQVKHETVEALGRQKRLLKDNHQNFDVKRR